MDIIWNAITHQDSETSCKWETIQVALMSNSCAIHHATGSFIHELVKMEFSIQIETKFSVKLFQRKRVNIKFQNSVQKNRK